jgi:hypothetical protein
MGGSQRGLGSLGQAGGSGRPEHPRPYTSRCYAGRPVAARRSRRTRAHRRKGSRGTRAQTRATGPSNAHTVWYVGCPYMPLGVIAEQACGRPSRAVPVRAAGLHSQISAPGARVVPSRWWSRWWWCQCCAVPSGAGVVPSAPSWLSLYQLPALPLHPHPPTSTSARTHTTLPSPSLSPTAAPPFFPRSVPRSNTPPAVCSAVCWLRARPLRCATSAADSPDTPTTGDPSVVLEQSSAQKPLRQRPHHWSQPDFSFKIPPITSAAVAACAFLDDPAAL